MAFKSCYRDRNKQILAEHVSGSSIDLLGEKYGLLPARIREIVGFKPRAGCPPTWRWRLYCSCIGKQKGPSVFIKPFFSEEEARRARPTIDADLVLLQCWSNARRVFAGSERL